MSERLTSVSKSSAAHSDQASVATYTTGFILSILLTVIPFLAVTNQWLNTSATVALLFGFAVLQLYVQLRFFLHLGQGRDRKWNFAALSFMLLVVLIVVVGSLWIMSHLNYHMMPGHQQETQLLRDEGIRQQ